MFLSDPEWQAVLLSLKVSSLAVVLSLPFGIFFSWLLVRRDFPGTATGGGRVSLADRDGATRFYRQLAV